MELLNKKTLSHSWLKIMNELEALNLHDGKHLIEYWDKKFVNYRFRIHPEVYHVVTKYVGAQFAPFITEALYCTCTTCYRNKFENLFKLLVIDNAIERKLDNTKKYFLRWKSLAHCFRAFLILTYLMKSTGLM